MKKITYLLIVLVLASCQKEDTDGIPTYIKIKSIELEGNITPSITDAWVYINGQFQGVYELPAKFPVLEQGNTNIKVYAGIKSNGIASDRAIYPFYSADTINELLTINSTTEIYPTVNIKENIGDGQFDDFESNYSFNYDAGFKGVIFEDGNNYGSLSLSDSDSILITEINYKDFPLSFDNVPQQGSPTYMELDYKNNTSFLVGMYINFPNSPTLEKGLLWINPKEDWNKIYIDLTQTVSEAIGAETFSVFIKMQRDSNLDENKLDFDNIRIIHYEK
jgi:hypothetical protein